MIRRAKAGDIPALGRLLEQVERVHHNGRPDLFKDGGRKYDDRQLEKLIPDDKRPIFVYEDGAGEVLGYAFCVLEDHSGDSVMAPVLTMYIDDICVFEHVRGKGVGRALCGYVKEYAGSLGCHNVTLNAWACNPGAVAFYEKMGFTPYKFGMETLL